MNFLSPPSLLRHLFSLFQAEASCDPEGEEESGGGRPSGEQEGECLQCQLQTLVFQEPPFLQPRAQGTVAVWLPGSLVVSFG